MDLLAQAFAWFVDLAASVVALFPKADVAAAQEALAPVTQVLGVLRGLNEYIPVVELLAMFSVVMGVWAALYAVMLIRRTFSLVWPGAGG